MKINPDAVKRFARKALIQVAESAVMISIDQAVRVFVSAKLKPYFSKKENNKEQNKQ